MLLGLSSSDMVLPVPDGLNAQLFKADTVTRETILSPQKKKENRWKTGLKASSSGYRSREPFSMQQTAQHYIILGKILAKVMRKRLSLDVSCKRTFLRSSFIVVFHSLVARDILRFCAKKLKNNDK